ncbi:sulfurtransferase TusA family protein [Aquisalinus flavus]|uniref:UPF0033 domain-containing protein n=1 Tax=Aquisalinus flavus TaxID=1526572 RepID=A0A8J2V4E7_9PROT|nr:sulfurtransferase TusA family protein [Aquisalinus flavus]MBD0426492.1 sulfurtransferase TusA family protein [Aquisalinus flavus]UNE47956.1 sulfurtransferase TusA family protein [Aquisalinus flavus]GGD07526.1 hypothetical protein GCM10011342_15420 [Aquisalinus flavus]
MSKTPESASRPVEVLDVRGLRCPMPVIRAESALRRLQKGCDLKVIADDPIARIDIPHFCADAGHMVEEIDFEGKTVIFLITPAA